MTSNKLLWLKKYNTYMLVFVGLIIGSIYANVSTLLFNKNETVFDDDFLMSYTTIALDSFSLWKCVLQVRLRDFIVLTVLAYTNIRYIAIQWYKVYFGFASGSLISYAVMNYGFNGVWVYVISVMPHLLFYILAFRILCSLIVFMKSDNYSYRGGYNKKWSLVILTSLVIIVVLIGTYMEAVINPVLIKRICDYLWL